MARWPVWSILVSATSQVWQGQAINCWQFISHPRVSDFCGLPGVEGPAGIARIFVHNPYNNSKCTQTVIYQKCLNNWRLYRVIKMFSSCSWLPLVNLIVEVHFTIPSSKQFACYSSLEDIFCNWSSFLNNMISFSVTVLQFMLCYWTVAFRLFWRLPDEYVTGYSSTFLKFYIVYGNSWHKFGKVFCTVKINRCFTVLYRDCQTWKMCI